MKCFMKDNLRNSITRQVLSTKRHHIVIEAATGVGKTKLALEKVKQLYSPEAKILIVIPRNVLIQNWKDEFKKWGYGDMLGNVTFVTYVSLPKMAGHWDIVVFDEAHHLSERCQQALSSFHISHCIFLSATLKKEHKFFIARQWSKDVEYVRVTTQEAIKSDVLPDPKIILIPLELDKLQANCYYYPRKISKSFNGAVKTIAYKDRWLYKRSRAPYRILCTQQQYYTEISALIDWYKRKNYNPVMKNLWLHKCGERLQWLSTIKLHYTQQIIHNLHTRFVVFCNTIEESEKLKMPAVNSKIGSDNLSLFNEGKIDNIVAVNCLNEGINLTNCQAGIFNAINASEIMQIQKVGRLLRHNNPFLIIPYYRNTREEEIVKKWIEGYNENLIFRLHSTDRIGAIKTLIKEK